MHMYVCFYVCVSMYVVWTDAKFPDASEIVICTRPAFSNFNVDCAGRTPDHFLDHPNPPVQMLKQHCFGSPGFGERRILEGSGTFEKRRYPRKNDKTTQSVASQPCTGPLPLDRPPLDHLQNTSERRRRHPARTLKTTGRHLLEDILEGGVKVKMKEEEGGRFVFETAAERNVNLCDHNQCEKTGSTLPRQVGQIRCRTVDACQGTVQTRDQRSCEPCSSTRELLNGTESVVPERKPGRFEKVAIEPANRPQKDPSSLDTERRWKAQFHFHSAFFV